MVTNEELVKQTNRNEYDEARWVAATHVLEMLRERDAQWLKLFLEVGGNTPTFFSRPQPIIGTPVMLQAHMDIVKKGSTLHDDRDWSFEETILKLVGLWPRGK